MGIDVNLLEDEEEEEEDEEKEKKEKEEQQEKKGGEKSETNPFSNFSFLIVMVSCNPSNFW